MHEKENEVLLQHYAMINDTVINQWLGAKVFQLQLFSTQFVKLVFETPRSGTLVILCFDTF